MLCCTGKSHANVSICCNTDINRYTFHLVMYTVYELILGEILNASLLKLILRYAVHYSLYCTFVLHPACRCLDANTACCMHTLICNYISLFTYCTVLLQYILTSSCTVFTNNCRCSTIL